MLVCDTCSEIKSIFFHQGICEICERETTCYEVPAALLVLKLTETTKTDKPEEPK